MSRQQRQLRLPCAALAAPGAAFARNCRRRLQCDECPARRFSWLPTGAAGQQTGPLPVTGAPARGNLLAGTGRGVLPGGYFLLWLVAPSRQRSLPPLRYRARP